MIILPLTEAIYSCRFIIIFYPFFSKFYSKNTKSTLFDIIVGYSLILGDSAYGIMLSRILNLHYLKAIYYALPHLFLRYSLVALAHINITRKSPYYTLLYLVPLQVSRGWYSPSSLFLVNPPLLQSIYYSFIDIGIVGIVIIEIPKQARTIRAILHLKHYSKIV